MTYKDKPQNTTNKIKLSKVWVVIPAAGIGQRMSSKLPKQYLEIHDKRLIEHTLDCFLEHNEIAGIVVVLSENDEYWESINLKSKLKEHSTPLCTVKVKVQDGSTRSDSVIQGLQYLEQVMEVPETSWVMVHDAARPCLSSLDLDALLAVRENETVGGILGSPVRDTMKRSVTSTNDGITDHSKVHHTVAHTESRENLWHALTPQMFRLDALQKAIDACHEQGFVINDECSAMEFIGERPDIVESLHNNIKVTHPSDMAFASFLLSDKSRIKKNKE